MEFGLLSEIGTEQKTWENKLFLTTDIDWACDEVIEYVFSFFTEMNAKVTWFSTHATEWNSKINDNSAHLIGCHPNFNPLLTGNFNKDHESILKELLAILPPTNVVRSHSTTQSSPILDLFCKYNLSIESNVFLPVNSNIVSVPFYHFDGTLRVPYIWSDDIHLLYKWDHYQIMDEILNYKGARVIDCHPIHIFLNTDKPERYNDARPFLKDYASLRKMVNHSNYGIRNFLEDLFSKL